MKRIGKILLLAAVPAALIGCSSSSTATTEASTTVDETTVSEETEAVTEGTEEGDDISITGTYSRFVQGDDWGAGVTSITIKLDHPLDAVDQDSFSITEVKDSTDFSDQSYPTITVSNERTITDAYLVDEDGKQTEDASNLLKIEMSIDPNTGSPFQYLGNERRNVWASYELEIALNDGVALTSNGQNVASLSIDSTFTETTTSADVFKLDSFTAEDGTSYDYAYFEPAEDSKTLVVWLHGGGEGKGEGLVTDPFVVLLANEAANLGLEEFQTAIGGAHVLVPQSPTYWIQDENMPVDADTETVVFKNSGTSIYTESLHELIMSYKEKVGAEKIVLAGCSNGGFMTLVLGRDYPEEYDILVPICGPLSLDKLTNEDMDKLKDKPMFFIWAENDTTVTPDTFEIPMIAAFEEAGFTSLHTFHPDTVEDTTGRFYLDEEGNLTTEATDSPYQYAGHWSWTYFFNNTAVDADGLSSWDFIKNNLR